MTYIIAHIGGVPVEEFLVPLASGASVVSAGVLLARAWVVTRTRRRASPPSAAQRRESDRR
jgi:hypothetical protein